MPLGVFHIAGSPPPRAGGVRTPAARHDAAQEQERLPKCCCFGGLSPPEVLTSADLTNTNGSRGSFSGSSLAELFWCCPGALPVPCSRQIRRKLPDSRKASDCFSFAHNYLDFSIRYFSPLLLLRSDSQVDLLSLKALLVQAILHSPIFPLAQPLSPSFLGFGQRGTKTVP